MEKEAKLCVATKKEEALNELYPKLGTPEREKAVFHLAWGRNQKTKDEIEGYFVNCPNRIVLTQPKDNGNRWKGFASLLNEGRPRKA